MPEIDLNLSDDGHRVANPTAASDAVTKHAYFATGNQQPLTNHYEIDFTDPQGPMAEMATPKKKQLPSWLSGVLVLVPLVMVIFLIHFTGESDDPLENVGSAVEEIFSMLGLVEEDPYGFDQSFQEPAPLPRAPKELQQEPAPEASATALDSSNPLEEPAPLPQNELLEVEEEIFANPYWYISNPLLPHSAPMGSPMGGKDEERYRAGLDHEYVYQAYRSVRMMRFERKKGAESVLFDAVAHRKFWVRMEALVALAEFGFELDLETIEQALQGVRPYLVSYYFKRYLKNPSSGGLYVLKQAIRLADAPGRLMVLKVLSRRHWRGHEHYLAAATLDTSPMIQKWLQDELEYHPLSGRVLASYKREARENYQKAFIAVEEQPQVIDVTSQEDTLPNVVEFFGQENFKEEPAIEDLGAPIEELEEPSYDDGFSEINGVVIDEQELLETQSTAQPIDDFAEEVPINMEGEEVGLEELEELEPIAE